MKAALLEAPRSFRLTSVDEPRPGAGEVLLRVEGCGICGSELPAFEGRDWFTYPFPPGAPGHESWGTVVAVGDGVASVAEGDRVAGLAFRSHAELDVARADSLVPIPAVVGDRPFPGEALGCAMNIFERSGIAAGDTVAVVGIGFLGALLVQLAAGAGASVIAVARRRESLELAERMGAEHCVAVDADPVGEIERLTRGEICDRVIECTGAEEPLDLAGRITRVRGRLVIAGYHQDGRRSIDMQLWNWRGLDVVNAHERDPRRYVDGMRRAAAAVEAKELDPFPLFTHRFPLDDIDRAFDAATSRLPGFVKAVVMP
ncbi:MAG TPA: zinc-binding dehydrogenase [Actinomycetota bacterium]|nr:zinc-binding dehydrogenase [Actinomycetota bacterium]